MKDRVDKSMGIVTLISEALSKIKPTDPLRLAERAARKKRNYADSSGNSPAKILAARCACRKEDVYSHHRRDPESSRRTGKEDWDDSFFSKRG